MHFLCRTSACLQAPRGAPTHLSLCFFFFFFSLLSVSTLESSWRRIGRRGGEGFRKRSADNKMIVFFRVFRVWHWGRLPARSRCGGTRIWGRSCEGRAAAPRHYALALLFILMCLTNLCEMRFRQGIPAERFSFLLFSNFLFFLHRGWRNILIVNHVFWLPPLCFFCFLTAAAGRNFN